MKKFTDKGIEMLCPAEWRKTTRDKLKRIRVDKVGGHKEIANGLTNVFNDSCKAAVLLFKKESEETIKTILQVSNEIIQIEKVDIEAKNCHSSLRYLLDQKIEGKVLDDKTIKALYSVYEFSLLSIPTDFYPLADDVYCDGKLESQALGLSIIAEGVADGARRTLSSKEENGENHGPVSVRVYDHATRGDVPMGKKG